MNVIAENKVQHHYQIMHPAVKHSREALLLRAQASLRMVAAATSLTAMCVMLTSDQTAVIYGIPVTAHYTYSSTFRYDTDIPSNIYTVIHLSMKLPVNIKYTHDCRFIAAMDAVTCAFCLLSLLILFVLSRHAHSQRSGYFILFLLDLMMMALMLAGCGGAIAIGMVGMYGNSHTGWAAICDHMGKFCHGAVISIVLSILSTHFLMMLTILSSYHYSRQKE
ncbi:hypothetical protein SAY86_015259 [Trapa natans]|uniref:CASP-like protein n=1 Tax=Trapa natans TaxID=22666 RepID=A0AAN7QH33_TRANT|nr:hypothetical protein SAY86_015259 [Trapa natans]